MSKFNIGDYVIVRRKDLSWVSTMEYLYNDILLIDNDLVKIEDHTLHVKDIYDDKRWAIHESCCDKVNKIDIRDLSVGDRVYISMPKYMPRCYKYTGYIYDIEKYNNSIQEVGAIDHYGEYIVVKGCTDFWHIYERWLYDINTIDNIGIDSFTHSYNNFSKTQSVESLRKHIVAGIKLLREMIKLQG